MAKIEKFLFFCLIILALSFVVAEGVSNLSGSIVKAVKGSYEVPYGIHLDNEESVAGFQMEISYPLYLNYKRIELSESAGEFVIVQNNGTEGVLKVAALSEEGIAPGQGTLFDVIFDVEESALAGNYSIGFSYSVFADINTTVISFSVVNGSFEIVEPYNVTFLPPISTEQNFTLQEGATLPLKFDARLNGGFVGDDSVLVRVFNQSLGIDETYNASGEGDNYLRINETEEQYLLNMHTGQLNMPEGRYEVSVSFDSFQESRIFFDLVNKSQGIGKGKKK